MKWFKLLTILVFSLTFFNAKAQDNGAGHKIVFQLTDNNLKSQKSLTRQLNNLNQGWPEAEFQVVVHSAGIGYLIEDKSAFSDEIRNLSEMGVVFVACENTLSAKNISKDKVIDVAKYVKMGIAEVVRKQEQGWSYIKAGL
jgi:intracellular sulfur oxidation DsrE/DsrF family protein